MAIVVHTSYLDTFEGWSELTWRKLRVAPRRSSPPTDNMDLPDWLSTSTIDTNHACGSESDSLERDQSIFRLNSCNWIIKCKIIKYFPRFESHNE